MTCNFISIIIVKRILFYYSYRTERDIIIIMQAEQIKFKTNLIENVNLTFYTVMECILLLYIIQGVTIKKKNRVYGLKN